MRRRQKATSYRTKTKAKPRAGEGSASPEEEFQKEEPSLAEATVAMKRRRRKLRRLAIPASLLTLAYWALVLPAQYGYPIPYYSQNTPAQLAVSLVLQAGVLLCGWPRAAMRKVSRRAAAS